MFKDFDTKPFKKKKPPVDSGYTTRTEINELKKIPLNKKFVKDYDKNIAAKLIKESAPVILELKKHHNRKRPYELDKKLSAFVMKSMKTPSYPSGHSVQGFLIGNYLSDKYPRSRKGFMATAKNISYSRRVARAHYKSDSKMGEELGNSMYKHIKNSI
tara:strand:+ start:70 stop:543 length:474 start_codon:yes stop_codon:yes gene_type:complete